MLWTDGRLTDNNGLVMDLCTVLMIQTSSALFSVCIKELLGLYVIGHYTSYESCKCMAGGGYAVMRSEMH